MSNIRIAVNQARRTADTAFPVPQQELDNNPDINQSCPSGPPWS